MSVNERIDMCPFKTLRRLKVFFGGGGHVNEEWRGGGEEEERETTRERAERREKNERAFFGNGAKCLCGGTQRERIHNVCCCSRLAHHAWLLLWVENPCCMATSLSLVFNPFLLCYDHPRSLSHLA